MSAPSSSSSSSSLTGTGSAPGRLDVLGGVADYSGSHVLQMSIAAQTHVTVEIYDGDMIIVKSTGRDDISIAWKDIEIHLKHPDLIDACTSFRTYLRTTTLPHWSYYVLGSILAYTHVMSWHPSSGLHLTITSDVPEGMGVSSSAAIEVATIRALEDLACKTSPSTSRFTGTHLARTAQLVENHVAGAPCGLMDQLASAYGAHDALLPIMCRPDVLYPLVQLPKGVCVVGWCSGVKHSIGASPYAIARCASFMGKAILSRQLSRTWIYSTEITPSLFSAHQHLLPINMTGAEYLKEYHSVNDSQSHIIPEITYPIRAAISFPLHENYRVQVATELLRSCTGDDNAQRTHVLSLVGELLYQSHAGYSSMGLGCATTDAMVSQLMTLGVEHGIYGARISGGGSGGTVVVLCTTDAVARVDQLRRDLPSSHNLPLIR